MERKTSLQTTNYNSVLQTRGLFISTPTLRTLPPASTCLNKQIIKAHHGTLAHTSLAPLSPWFVTGFTDGEGSFGIYFPKSSQHKLGYQLKYEFTIALHK